MKIKNNKRGISVMIGYVLLITFAIVMSVVVYNWMESYVPKEKVKCEDGVSLIVKNYNCDSSELNITLLNNGRFSLAGFVIHGKENETAEIATIDLSENLTSKKFVAEGKIYFGGGGANSLPSGAPYPGEGIFMTFNISSYDEIPEIEIIPVREVEWKNKPMTAVCGNARIEETVNC